MFQQQLRKQKAYVHLFEMWMVDEFFLCFTGYFTSSGRVPEDPLSLFSVLLYVPKR